MATKTNAARILDKMGVNYELVEYPVDENDLSATAVAVKMGQNIEQVYKTLVLRGDKTGVFVTVIPGGDELDLKLAAKVSGNKNAAMIAVKDILELTGYIRGGCSPIGMKKRYPIFFHQTCLEFDYVFVSAGVRGLQLKINPNDLVKAGSGVLCNLLNNNF